MPANQSFLDLELCQEAVTASSNTVETQILDISLIKEASCGYVIAGGKLCYTVKIVNNSDMELTDVVFRDPLPDNLTYVEDSFVVDGEEETPTMDGDNVLIYTLTVPPNSTVVIEFCVIVDKEVVAQPPV